MLKNYAILIARGLVTEEDYIPIKDVYEEEIALSLASEFECNVDNLYYSDSEFSKLAYYNKNNGNIISIFQGATMFRDMIKQRDEIYDKCISNKNIKKLLALTDGKYRLMIFKRIYKHIDKSNLYDTFIQIYHQSADYGFNRLCNSLDFDYILSNNRLPEDKIKTISDYIDCEGYVAIYRAQGTMSTPIEKAISWTLSKDIANRFAYVHNLEGNGEIYSAVVHIDDIIDYIDNRDEEEIIVRYSDLKDIELLY